MGKAMRTLRWTAIAAVAAVLLAAAQPAAASDNQAGAETLFYGNPVTTNVSAFATEAGEPQTFGVAAFPGATCGGISMTRTEWFTLEGTGTPITVSTAGSTVPIQTGAPVGNDTLLAVYSGSPANTEVGCNDDFGGARTSAVTFTGDAHTRYLVQAGVYCGNAAADCAPATARGGTLKVMATNTGAPANDLRANATALPLNSTTHQSNTAATVEAGETTSCATQVYGKTLWWKFHLANPGQIRLHAGSQTADSVIALYAAASATPLACNDDDGSGNFQSAIQADVGAGDYLLQLGGFGSSPGATTADFPIALDFTPNFDVDKDGVLSPAGGGADCNDNDAAIKPGAADPPNDNVDQNCDGRDPKDGDGDGVLAPPDGNDCNDAGAAVKPGATDVPANGIDEDCDGKDAAKPVVNTPIVLTIQRVAAGLEFKYDTVGTGVRLTRYTAVDVPAGATLDLRCSGKGCPFKRKQTVVPKAKKKVALVQHFKHKRLRSGTKLTLMVTVSKQIGLVKTHTVRKGKLGSATTQCLAIGATKPGKC